MAECGGKTCAGRGWGAVRCIWEEGKESVEVRGVRDRMEGGEEGGREGRVWRREVGGVVLGWLYGGRENHQALIELCVADVVWKDDEEGYPPENKAFK